MNIIMLNIYVKVEEEKKHCNFSNLIQMDWIKQKIVLKYQGICFNVEIGTKIPRLLD